MATIVDQAKAQMDKTVEATEENFVGIRTGRANPSLLNGITVDYYGAQTPLKALASISVPEPRTLAVMPFDQSQAPAVEKAIRDSDLGVNPSRDGNVIRVTLPELTEERRKELAKQVRKYGEEAKVAVRNIRRDAMDTFKKEQKKGEITEDDLKDLEKDMQKLTDDYIKEVDKLTAAKEKELFEI